MDLSARQSRILKAVVEAFVETGEPASSKSICELLNNEASSATMRNEMALLVELGFLEQPHTSAGRVPTHKGYRYYIDRLMGRPTLSREERYDIDNLLQSILRSPEHIMEGASALLALLTKLAALTAMEATQDDRIKNIELILTARRAALVVLMTRGGIYKSRICRTDADLIPELLHILTKLINEKFAGLPLHKITPALIQTVAAGLGELALPLSPVLMAVYEIVREIQMGEVHFEGQLNLLGHPEYEHTTLRELSALFSKRGVVDQWMQGQRKTRTVLGRESGYQSLADSGIIIKRYSAGGTNTGIIAVIGPVRMDYRRLIPSIEYFTQSLEHMMIETFEE